MQDARLHLKPYSDPHFPLAVASTLTPAGPMTAGRNGVGILSLGAGMPGGSKRIGDELPTEFVAKSYDVRAAAALLLQATRRPAARGEARGLTRGGRRGDRRTAPPPRR